MSTYRVSDFYHRILHLLNGEEKEKEKMIVGIRGYWYFENRYQVYTIINQTPHPKCKLTLLSVRF